MSWIDCNIKSGLYENLYENLHHGSSWAASAKLQLQASKMCSTDTAVVELTFSTHRAALVAVVTGIHMISQKEEELLIFLLHRMMTNEIL